MNVCRQAGHWQESERILQQLVDNAVMQHQYSLAASLHHQLAMEAVDEVHTSLTMLVVYAPMLFAMHSIIDHGDAHSSCSRCVFCLSPRCF